jgi:hypothetical protein
MLLKQKSQRGYDRFCGTEEKHSDFGPDLQAVIWRVGEEGSANHQTP